MAKKLKQGSVGSKRLNITVQSPQDIKGRRKGQSGSTGPFGPKVTQANEIVGPPDKSHRKSLDKPVHNIFPIVGIGSSAGGLEALSAFFDRLPSDTGMAFVVVAHLDPNHESALAQLLSRSTRMQVVEAKNNQRLEPDRVHIIPPNRLITIAGRLLKLTPRRDGLEDRMPVDHFLDSLAEEAASQSVGIVLSGNGSDGTLGLLAIKAAGGITFAQEERTAKYPTMPANAIRAGCVDFVLSPARIADELARMAGRLQRVPVAIVEDEQQPSSEEKVFDEILRLVRQRTSVDFTYYKHATIRRRLQRRMTLHKMDSMKEYLVYLRTHIAEARELFNDILIHVTGFFRDAAVYTILRRKIFPRLLRGKGREETIRIWVPGCSTGEEAYSLAIALSEAMDEKKLYRPVQIFATDINETTLERARTGLYPESIQADITPERLRRHFTRSDGGFRVNKAIRAMCIFARQNLAMDPPFSNLDFISCRNVLIYLAPILQRKVMPVFHYALRPTGQLMLGVSETVGTFSDLFALTDKKARIYAKKAVQTPAVNFTTGVPPGRFSEVGERPATVVAPALSDVQKHADRIMLTGYGPAGVIINKHMKVLQFRGRTGIYLEHPHGEANFDLLKMVKEGLALDIRSAVAKAMKQNARVRHEHARVRQNGGWLDCTIEVIPFSVPPSTDNYYLVLFDSKPGHPAEGKKKKAPVESSSLSRSDEREILHLREELAATRDSVQTIIEEQEATNEELRSANEEIMSSNEELQSTNEELETAKEELQSTNEELTTLNDELESRNSELEQVNNDLHNLLGSVNVPVIILASDLRIRRFTAMAERMFKLIPGDIGRPITDINMPLEIPELDKLVHEVLDSLAPKDLEVRDKGGHWWSVRIRAYKTMEHKIDGAVIALMDIDMLKSAVDSLGRARQIIDSVVSTVRSPLLILDEQYVIKQASASFCHKFALKPEEIASRRLFELGNGQWNIIQLRALLEKDLQHQSGVENFEFEHDFPNVGRKRISLNVRRLKLGSTEGDLFLLAFEDVVI